MHVDLRPFHPDDLPALRDLAERTFRDAWQTQNDPAAFEEYCRTAFHAESVAEEVGVPGSEFYLAWSDGRPVAYLKINLDRPPHDWTEPEACVQIERIYVLEAFQGQRIGEQFLHLAEERARLTGAGWLWLSVWQEAPRSIRFYERNGFSIFGVETFWVGSDAQADWVMKRTVPAMSEHGR